MPAATAHGDELFFKGWPGLPVEVVAPADAVAAFRNEALSKAPPVLNSANVPICGTRRSPNAPQQIRVPFVSSPQVSLLIDLKVLPRECRHIHRHSRESGNPKTIGSKCVLASYRILGSRFRGNDGNRR